MSIFFFIAVVDEAHRKVQEEQLDELRTVRALLQQQVDASREFHEQQMLLHRQRNEDEAKQRNEQLELLRQEQRMREEDTRRRNDQMELILKLLVENKKQLPMTTAAT